MVAKFIQIVLSNPSVSLLVLGLIAAAISLLRRPRPWKQAAVIEALFAYFLLFSIGIGYLYNFVIHTFFAEMAAHFIGWANSPFQYEVGFASLGLGVNGLLAFRSGLGFRAAAVIAPSLFVLGAAGGHVYQMIHAHNFAPGNAGTVFWTDVFVPVIAFTLLYLQYRTARAS